MRSTRAVAAAAVFGLGLAGYGPRAGADGANEPLAVARADLAAVVAHAHVGGTWQVERLRRDDGVHATIAEVSTPFAADPGDPLADPPTAIADTFELAIGPPVHAVSHADPEKLRAALTAGPAALTIARERLKQESRYRGWQTAHTHYLTSVTFARGHVFVYFSPPLITDSDITIEVDPGTSKVVSVHLGMA